MNVASTVTLEYFFLHLHAPSIAQQPYVEQWQNSCLSNITEEFSRQKCLLLLYSKHCFDQNKLEIVDISSTVLDMHQFQTLQGIAKAVLYMCHNKNDYWILWIYFTNANIYSEHKDLFDFFISSQSASVVFIITGE